MPKKKSFIALIAAFAILGIGLILGIVFCCIVAGQMNNTARYYYYDIPKTAPLSTFCIYAYVGLVLSAPFFSISCLTAAHDVKNKILYCKFNNADPHPYIKRYGIVSIIEMFFIFMLGMILSLFIPAINGWNHYSWNGFIYLSLTMVVIAAFMLALSALTFSADQTNNLLVYGKSNLMNMFAVPPMPPQPNPYYPAQPPLYPQQPASPYQQIYQTPNYPQQFQTSNYPQQFQTPRQADDLNRNFAPSDNNTQQ